MSYMAFISAIATTYFHIASNDGDNILVILLFVVLTALTLMIYRLFERT